LEKPLDVSRLVTVGAARVKVNRSAVVVAEVPAVVVTVISTVPTGTAGAMTLIDVGESTVNFVAATLPHLIPATSVKLLPVMTTVWPPYVDPLATFSAAMVGSAPAGVIVNLSAEVMADVPAGLVMAMSATVADASCVGHAGTTTVRTLSDTTVKL